MRTTVRVFGKQYQIDTTVPVDVLHKHLRHAEETARRAASAAPGRDVRDGLVIAILELIEHLHGIERARQQDQDRLRTLARRIERIAARIEHRVRSRAVPVDTEGEHLVQ